MLAILATHPIQYQVPIWQQLAERSHVPFEVWYLTAHGVAPSLDAEFGKVFKWDIDMLGGYPYRFPPEPVAKQLGGFRDVRLPSDFRMRLKSGEIKALFVPGWSVRAYWEAVFLAHRMGIPVWIRGDSNDLKADRMIKGVVKRVLLGAFFRRVDRFLCVGKATRRLYESYGVREKRLVWAPHAVDNSRFADQAAEQRPNRVALRRAWGIPDDACCILFLGKFIPEKRPADLIAALGLLNTVGSSRRYHVLMVGSGELGDVLRSQCRVVFDAEPGNAAQENADSVIAPVASFAGFMNQSEISMAIVAADMLVLPSSSETWGLVVNEALASGLPCVVSDACGSAEDLVVPLDAQLRFPMGDQPALARAIKHLADHPLSSQAMAAHIAKYDFIATVETLEKLWREVQ